MHETPLRERRQSPRVRVDQLAYINLISGNGGIVLDISESGLGLQAVAPLDDKEIRFRLSVGSTDEFEALAELVWRDQTGKRGGLRFKQLPAGARKEISKLLGRPESFSPRIANSFRAVPREIHSNPASKQGFAAPGPGEPGSMAASSVATTQPVLEGAKPVLGPQRESSLKSRTILSEPTAPKSSQPGLNPPGTFPQGQSKTWRASTRVSGVPSGPRITTVALVLTLGLAIGVSSFIYRSDLGHLLVRLGEGLSGTANSEDTLITVQNAGSQHPSVSSDESVAPIGVNPADAGTSSISRGSDSENVAPGDHAAAGFSESEGGAVAAASGGARSRKISGMISKGSAVSDNGNGSARNLGFARNSLRDEGVTGRETPIPAEQEAGSVSDQSEQKAGLPLTPPPAPAPPEIDNTRSPESTVTAFLTSNPDGADVYVDDSFVGKAPMTLKLKPGKHAIRMFMNRYHNWSQWVTVDAGSGSHIAGVLEKSN